MATVTGSDAVYLKALDVIGAQLAKLTLDLWGENGRETFQFARCAPAVAKLVAEFHAQHGRAPAMIFNDGFPPSYATQLKASPDAARGTVVYPLDCSTPEQVNIQTIPAFAVRVYANPGSVTYTGQANAGQGSTVDESRTAPYAGPYNSRAPSSWMPQDPYAPPIPQGAIVGGAYQTWAVLLVAMSHPEFLQCSDEGLILTPDGVAMIERSMSAWAVRAVSSNFFLGADTRRLFGDGPALYGIPYSIIDTMRVQWARVQKSGGFATFAMQLASWALSFAGFYAGAAALSGVLGGAFTLGNLSGTLSMASRFGVDTTKLNFALKLGDLTTGNILAKLPASSTGGAAMPDVSLSDIGAGNVDPSQVDFSNLMPDASNADFGAPIDIPQDWWTAGLDPTDPTLADPTNIPADLAYMNDQGIVYDGTVIATADEVSSVSQQVATDPAAAQQATQQVAQRIQDAASSAGVSISMADVMKNATAIVGLAAQWQTIQQKRANGTLGIGSNVLTTSNGSKVITNPDGSRTVIYPNGQVSTLPKGYNSPGVPGSLIAGVSNTTLALGAAGVLAIVMLARR